MSIIVLSERGDELGKIKDGVLESSDPELKVIWKRLKDEGISLLAGGQVGDDLVDVAKTFRYSLRNEPIFANELRRIGFTVVYTTDPG